MKKIFISQAARRRCQYDNLAILVEAEKQDIKSCVHNDYCYVRQIKGGSCFVGMKDCRAFKFYNKYNGEQGNYLGI